MTSEATAVDTPAQTSEPEAPAPAPAAEAPEATMKDAPGENKDDSITTQLKNTTNQVTGTWKKLAASFQTAGKKVSGAFSGAKNKTSTKKAG